MTFDATASDETDASETSGASGEGDGSAPTIGATLSALQEADTAIDQLVHRRDRLPERDALAAATDRMKTWEARRLAMRSRLDELTAVIERSEAGAAELITHRQRLEAQMKTVIAPREAEALMHEIDTLNERRDGVETIEIEALEEQATLDDDLTEHLADEMLHREDTTVADEALVQVVSEIDAEIAQITDRRDALRAGLPDALLARYDRIRASSGRAVASLVGHRCNGCHLDLSAAEVDDLKDEAAANDGIADCPQCGRMLVI